MRNRLQLCSIDDVVTDEPVGVAALTASFTVLVLNGGYVGAPLGKATIVVPLAIGAPET